jgi:RNA 2',3'-cyclic 3'-phosphodiesterase
MRLFIAIDLSKEAVSELQRLQNELIDENVKCSLSKSFHLTLKFLGEVKEKDVSELLNKLDKVNFKEFTLTLDKLGVFSDSGEIKVLWVGIEKNEILTDLYSQIKKILPEFKNDKEFSPHLTLARIKSADNKNFMKKINQAKVNKVEFKVSLFSLYRSTLTKDGAYYEVIEEFE